MASVKNTRTRKQQRVLVEAAPSIAPTESRASLLTRASTLPALFLFATLSISATEPQIAVVKHSTDIGVPAFYNRQEGPPKITYVEGQLTINAYDVTLAEVLAKVGTLTGVAIELPDGANRERMPIVRFGPAPAREVLASLLSDSSFDYIIQGSDDDSEKLQSLMLMPRKKKGSVESAGVEVATSRNTRFRTSQQPAEDTAAPDNSSAQVSAENIPTETTAPPPPQAPPTQNDMSAVAAASQHSSSDGLRPGALTPPATMSSDNINQQLNQMYQQRMQMIQQNNQSVPPVNPN